MCIKRRLPWKANCAEQRVFRKANSSNKDSLEKQIALNKESLETQIALTKESCKEMIAAADACAFNSALQSHDRIEKLILYLVKNSNNSTFARFLLLDLLRFWELLSSYTRIVSYRIHYIWKRNAWLILDVIDHCNMYDISLNTWGLLSYNCVEWVNEWVLN